jgi:ACS family hexuronate transporter-like MFS transporter
VVVREHLYAGGRHVSAPGSWIGCRDRGFAGAIGGVLFQRTTGIVLQGNGNNYVPIFIVCGLAYVSALAIIHLLVPKIQRMDVSHVSSD